MWQFFTTQSAGDGRRTRILGPWAYDEMGTRNVFQYAFWVDWSIQKATIDHDSCIILPDLSLKMDTLNIADS